jgi:hypothetical protein
LRIAPEARLPKLVAYHGDRRTAGRGFLGTKSASAQRIDAQNPQEVADTC